MAQPIIKRARVHFDPSEGERPRAAHDLRADAAAGEPVQHEKQVRLLEEGGRVIGIELSCGCGEVTAIELEYPSNPASPPPASEHSPTPAS